MSARLRLLFFLSFALLSVAEPAGAAAEWQVVKVGSWDYLTLDNIAKFYGFSGSTAPVEKTIRLDNGRNQLEVMLDSREAIVNGVRNWLCFPVLQGPDGKYLLSRIDLAKTIEPQFRPHLIRDLRPLKTVVIDAGHGGIEKGAASSYGLEKDFTLDVARRLRALLEAKGLRVVMTREGDDLVPLPERARIANATRDSIFVSIHFNATDWNANATGFEIYSLTPRGAPSTQDNSLQARFANMQAGSPADAASLILSTAVYHSMLGSMPEFDRGVKRARFAVLRLTQIPAILVEGGFLTERDESRLIARPEWRQKLADAISLGVENFKALVEKKQRPRLLADYRRQFEGVLVARDGNAPPAGDAAALVQPASNLQSGLTAQMTNPVHHEPSPQLDLGRAAQEEDDEHPTGRGPDAPPAPSVGTAVESGVAPVTEPTAVPTAAPDAITINMPAPADLAEADSSGVGVASPRLEGAELPMPSAPPSDSVAPPVVRKYWILKFDPPPKFRQ